MGAIRFCSGSNYPQLIGELRLSHFLMLMAILVFGCPPERTVIIECDPDAKVTIDSQQVGTTPYTGKLRWDREETIRRIQVQASDYEPKEISLSHLIAKDAPNPWRHSFSLERISHALPIKVSTNPPGATLTVNGEPAGQTPRELFVRFARESSKAAWGAAQIRAELPNYLSKLQSVSYSEAQRGAVNLELDEIRREVTVSFTSTPDQAEVMFGDKIVGLTPCNVTIVFSRERGNLPWSQHPIRISRTGHRWKRPGGPVAKGDVSPFTSSITLDDAMAGRIHVEFEPILFVQTHLHSLEFTPEGAKRTSGLYLAEVSDGETSPNVSAPTQITRAPSGALHDTRIWVVPGSYDVVYSLPSYPSDQQDLQYNLVMITAAGQTSLTNESYRDMLACVSADGKFIAFSSNRLHATTERMSLHVIALSGQKGLARLTDSPTSYFDLYPAFSPDNEWVSYTTQLFQGKPPVWMMKSNGTLPTQLSAGTNAAWSPDSKRLAFVKLDEKEFRQIWILTVDGSEPPLCLTTGKSNHDWPVWTPDGVSLIYSSNVAINGEGDNNFDLWSHRVDGSQPPIQLTVNGSHDIRPAISSDGKYVFFLSNRGSRPTLPDNWQIWRIQLK
ncbi:MAG: PD40 domain-containing protein [Phycisphaerales bacterium]|nr:PD40 domain-containing protein [Phycisphaerales bacterium]